MKDKVLQQQLEIVIEQLNKEHPTMRAFAGTVQQAIKRIEELEARLVYEDKMDCAIASEPVLEKDWTIVDGENGVVTF